MANEFDPYREALVVEARTIWPEEYDEWEDQEQDGCQMASAHGRQPALTPWQRHRGSVVHTVSPTRLLDYFGGDHRHSSLPPSPRSGRPRRVPEMK